MSRYAVVIDRVPVVSAVDAVVYVMETTPVPVLRQERHRLTGQAHVAPAGEQHRYPRFLTVEPG